MGDMDLRRKGDAARRRRTRSVGSLLLTPPRGLPVLPDPMLAAAARFDVISECRGLPCTVVDPCVCGHGRISHEHYRPGWDCGVCGSAECTDYRPVGGGSVRRALRRMGLVR